MDNGNLLMTGCGGVPRVLKDITRYNCCGHKLQCCDIGDRQLYFGVVCGSWAVSKCLDLAKYWKSPCASACDAAFKRVRKGQRPDTFERALENLLADQYCFEPLAKRRLQMSQLFSRRQTCRLDVLHKRIRAKFRGSDKA